MTHQLRKQNHCPTGGSTVHTINIEIRTTGPVSPEIPTSVFVISLHCMEKLGRWGVSSRPLDFSHKSLLALNPLDLAGLDRSPWILRCCAPVRVFVHKCGSACLASCGLFVHLTAQHCTAHCAVNGANAGETYCCIKLVLVMPINLKNVRPS